jgi:N-acetyl-D-muramate 6-phosphate phosphatase
MPATGTAPRLDAGAALLFDLDGTLIDSAPDLAAAANAMLLVRGLPQLPLQALRVHVGSGARGMVGAAFGLGPGDPGYEPLRDEFLQRYSQALLVHTKIFDAMLPVLGGLQRAGRPWGIVTNKALALAKPIVQHFQLLQAAASLVAGDSTPHRKPHPAPLLEAVRQLGLEAGQCVYVGDDPRDIAAGRAAGMATLAAGWGYLGEALPIDHWGADAVLASPRELLHMFDLA